MNIENEGPVPRAPTRKQAASYVAALTGELSHVARRHRMEALGYLLDMARLEARSLAGDWEPPEDGSSVSG